MTSKNNNVINQVLLEAYGVNDKGEVGYLDINQTSSDTIIHKLVGRDVPDWLSDGLYADAQFLRYTKPDDSGWVRDRMVDELNDFINGDK